jgi:hypothetical protein
MTDLNRLADLILPGIRNAQLKLEEVSNYLGVMPDSLRQYNGWQTIESAPKDETIVLIQKDGSQVVAFQDGGIWHCDLYGNELIDQDRITHWMPLPEPPK